MGRSAARLSHASPVPRRRPLGGLADAFAWPLRASQYLALLGPRQVPAAGKARLDAAWEEACGVRTLRIRPGRGWPGHRPGQYVRLGVPIGGAYHTRTFSISSAPDAADGCITVTVKAQADGRVSRHLVDEVRVGTLLQLGPPEGDFVLPDGPPAPLLFVTGGSGITPVMSMLRNPATWHGADIVHLHYACTAGDVIFRDELLALSRSRPGYRLHLLLTRDSAGRGAAIPRFGEAPLRALCPDWKARSAFACGPARLLAAAESCWRQVGAGGQLRTERFRAAFPASPAGAAGGRVRFACSQREVESDGGSSLLAVAEGVGLHPPHGCRMGICHTCAVTLRRGRVRDLRSDAVIDEPGAKVQLCVCAAAGDVELEA